MLFIVIGLFSLCLPFIKHSQLMATPHIPRQGDSFLDRRLSWVWHLGKWSMFDVFVVALLLVSVKLGALTKVNVQYGIYTFALAIILSMMASLMNKLEKRL